MKLRLTAIALLLAAAGAAQAENFRIVQSPSQKLDVWVDNVSGNTAKDWCGNELTLRIVTGGSKSPKVLDNFLPRVGALLEHQCSRLKQMNWSLVDGQNAQLAHGTAAKSDKWAVKVAEDKPAVAQQTAVPPAQQQAATTPALRAPDENVESRAAQADRTPWQEFTLQDGCRLRTFWQESSRSPALFIPSGSAGDCEKGGWLSGKSTLTRLAGGAEQSLNVTFVHGFPVSGLRDDADANSLLIAAVNNQRMVLSTGSAGQSWLILPYDAALSSWKVNGTLAVDITPEQAADAARVQDRIEESRKAWAPWLPADARLNVVLIDGLLPRLSNPAARAWRAAH